jgi:hypothetical protein
MIPLSDNLNTIQVIQLTTQGHHQLATAIEFGIYGRSGIWFIVVWSQHGYMPNASANIIYR